MTYLQRIWTVVLLVLISCTLSCLMNSDDPHRPTPEEALADANEPIVYIGNYGNTYHKETCTLMKLDRYPIELDEAKRFYKPCKRCEPVE